MELKKYLAIFKKHLLFILAFAIAGAATSVLLESRITPGPKVEQLFFVVPPQVTQNSFYNYEGYYSWEKARSFTDTAVAILESADFAKEITPANSFTVRKLAPQVIKITIKSPDPQTAKLITEKIASNFNQKISNLNGDQYSLQLKTITNSPNLVSASPNKKIIATFGIIAGFTFALFVVGIKTYLRL